MYNRGIERCHAGSSSLLRTKREPELVLAPVRGVRALFRWAKFSFACQKRTRKAPAIERLGGGEAMKAPVGLSSRQSGLRSKCRVFSAARTGIHEKGAARPFQTPKELSKRKKASRCAKTGCGSQRLLRCRSHPAGRGPNSSSLFPPLAAVVAVALFSRFSDLLLRSWCYALAGREVQQKGKIFGGAVNGRSTKKCV